MSKVTNIGSRLHSVERGNVVACANEILDDAKGKKQDVINNEVDAGLLRLDQSKQNNLTFDNTPTENSNNPVKSSGVYAADKALSDAIEAILILIPSAATALNQLADKNFVNSSIATDTATFRGTSETGLSEAQFLEWANGLTHDMNDYVFWQTIDEAGNTLFKRYKWNGTQWLYEYTLNNSSFTADQWAAIMSGITSALVEKLRDLPTAAQLITSFDAKQDVLTFDNVPTQGSSNPVKSGGVFSAIKDVTDLIPAEATNLNQLADKAYVLAQILAATPAFKGQFETFVELQAVASPKDGDLGIVRTKDSDGYDVFTFYQYLNNQWNVFYTLSYHLLNKPATTGTTGDYPYNGMGRVVIPKKMVNGVNTLTHEAFEDSEGNDRENTIYVIQYDFTLGEDITVPANCVLEFDGGSISGAYTLTGTNTGIQAGIVKIFNTDVTLAGTWNISEVYPEWFGAKGDNVNDDTNFIQKTIDCFEKTILFTKSYKSQTLNLNNNNIILKGIGVKRSRITYTNNSGGLICIGQDKRNIQISNIKLSASDYNDNTCGILFNDNDGGCGHSISEIEINGFGKGICSNGLLWYSYFKNVRIDRCNYNICFITNTANICNIFEHCYFEHPKRTNVFIKGGDLCNFINCNFGCEDAGGAFLELYNSSRIKFDNCNFETGDTHISSRRLFDFINCPNVIITDSIIHDITMSNESYSNLMYLAGTLSLNNVKIEINNNNWNYGHSVWTQGGSNLYLDKMSDDVISHLNITGTNNKVYKTKYEEIQ